MEQLLLHLIGDYVLQSDWMASRKTSWSFEALVHATVYSLPFLLLRPSWAAFAVILTTHFLIDRYRLAKYVCYAKNFLAPLSHTTARAAADGRFVYEEKYEWENCSETGYPSETPVWLATWLLIIVDNTMHLTINYLSLRYL